MDPLHKLAVGALVLGLACLAWAVKLGLEDGGQRDAAGTIVCVLRGRHEPQRVLYGGFRCRRCGLTGASLDELGALDDGWIKGGPGAKGADREVHR